MKWYNTKVGHLQIYGYLVAIVYTYMVNCYVTLDFSAALNSSIFNSMLFGGLILIFFIPSFIVSFLTKSEKIKIISVYIMIISAIISVVGQWYTFYLYETPISTNDLRQLFYSLWLFAFIALIPIFLFQFFRSKMLGLSISNQYVENDSSSEFSDDINNTISETKNRHLKEYKSKFEKKENNTSEVIKKSENIIKKDNATNITALSDDLIKLGELKDHGLLTEEEFNEQKKKLLKQ